VRASASPHLTPSGQYPYPLKRRVPWVWQRA
jgi:hypothetical protein